MLWYYPLGSNILTFSITISIFCIAATDNKQLYEIGNLIGPL